MSERLELGIDAERLRRHVEDVVRCLPPMMQNRLSYGGWSVLSASGDIWDGWTMGHTAFDQQGRLNRERLRELMPGGEIEHRRPTEICTGYLAEVMQQIEFLGLVPHRARIAALAPKSATSRHRDGPDGAYVVRLHIPIVTNAGCFFISDDGQEHMPADGGGYLVNVARWHQAVNRGESERLHLIMGVVDTKGITREHRRPIAA